MEKRITFIVLNAENYPELEDNILTVLNDYGIEVDDYEETVVALEDI